MSTGSSPSPNPPTQAPTGARRLVALAFATAAGVGFAPVAPGTFGAAVGVGVFMWLLPAGSPALVLAAGLLLGVGIWASGEAERIFQRHDDGRIVIDEVVGQLVALLPLAFAPAGRSRSPVLLFAGFLMFRLFDIWKPGPVRWAERLEGGTGVMLDDVVAGVLAGIVVAALLLATGEVAA